MNPVFEFISMLWSLAGVQLLMVLIALDVVTGVGASLYTRTFLLQKVGDFLVHKVLPYTIVYLFFAAPVNAVLANPGTAAQLGPAGGGLLLALPDVIWAALAAMLAGSIFENLTTMGIQLPARIITASTPTAAPVLPPPPAAPQK